LTTIEVVKGIEQSFSGKLIANKYSPVSTGWNRHLPEMIRGMRS